MAANAVVVRPRITTWRYIRSDLTDVLPEAGALLFDHEQNSLSRYKKV